MWQAVVKIKVHFLFEESQAHFFFLPSVLLLLILDRPTMSWLQFHMGFVYFFISILERKQMSKNVMLTINILFLHHIRFVQETSDEFDVLSNISFG